MKACPAQTNATNVGELTPGTAAETGCEMYNYQTKPISIGDKQKTVALLVAKVVYIESKSNSAGARDKGYLEVKIKPNPTGSNQIKPLFSGSVEFSST
jgi:hypothetical protein